MAEQPQPSPGPRESRRQRLAALLTRLHERYARTFWVLHSVWALLTGVTVLVLAHNRHGFIPWVVGFLALTWASTLFFSRFTPATRSRGIVLARGFVSYLTRVMYQETLFFLLPFYFYSATLTSWNGVFVIGLAALAVFSCFDLPFDRLLRSSRLFALSFFAVVTFSALQFFFPAVLNVRVHHGTYLAAALALLAAAPLAYSWQEIRQRRTLVKIAVALTLALVAARMLRPIVPPVPLRLVRVSFAAVLDPRTLRTGAELNRQAPISALSRGRLYAVATINAPNRLPAAINLSFYRNGEPLRTSRTVELIAHARGFRVWDALRAPTGGFVPGVYRLDVRTAEGQLLGRSTIRLVKDP